MLVNKRNREPYSCFREGFADTDAFSAKERREGQSVAIFSSWCLGPLIVRVAEIKSSRYKLAWLHPLVRVMVDLCKVHDVGHAFLEEDFFCAIAYTNILAEGLMTRDWRWWLNPQHFVKHMLKIRKLLDSVVCESLQDVVFDLLDGWQNLLEELFLVLGMLLHVVNHIGSWNLNRFHSC